MRKTIICILAILGMIFVFLCGVLIYETIEMLTDHYCYTLPVNEFYQEERCKKYWNEWSKKH